MLALPLDCRLFDGMFGNHFGSWKLVGLWRPPEQCKCLLFCKALSHIYLYLFFISLPEFAWLSLSFMHPFLHSELPELNFWISNGFSSRPTFARWLALNLFWILFAWWSIRPAFSFLEKRFSCKVCYFLLFPRGPANVLSSSEQIMCHRMQLFFWNDGDNLSEGLHLSTCLAVFLVEELVCSYL